MMKTITQKRIAKTKTKRKAKKSPAPLYNRVAIIGMGLIGSSIARVVKKNKLAREMVVYDSDAATRKRLAALKLGNRIAKSPRDAVRDADLIILAVPVGVMGRVAKSIAPHIKAGATITDTGSTKVSVMADVAPLLPADCHFIPSHPLAGTEFSGPDAGFAGLFRGRYWLIIDESGEADSRALKKLTAFIKKTGAIAEVMRDAAYHDKVMAITSHIPHLIAYTIVGTAFDFERKIRNDVIRFSASGFRDFTRIAASDPVMWRDVFLHNREAVLELLQNFRGDLDALQGSIEKGEGAKLKKAFTRTRDIRNRIRDLGQLD